MVAFQIEIRVVFNPVVKDLRSFLEAVFLAGKSSEQISLKTIPLIRRFKSTMKSEVHV